jgi:hypothetical protein
MANMNNTNKHSLKHNLKRKGHPAWSQRTAPITERYVHINYIVSGQIILVHSNFPLSLLLLYSKRAQRELPKLGKGQSKLTWDLATESEYAEADIRGLCKVLRWILYELPARGYSANYAGHPQLQGELIKELDFGMLVCILEAMSIFDLAPPLNQQREIPNIIKDHMDTVSTTNAELVMLFTRIQAPYEWLTNHTLHVAVDYYDKDPTSAETQEIQELRAEISGLDEVLSQIELKKARRMAGEQRRERHEAWLMRETRRMEKEDARLERNYRARERQAEAADGQRVLSDTEARQVMRR